MPLYSEWVSHILIEAAKKKNIGKDEKPVFERKREGKREEGGN